MAFEALKQAVEAEERADTIIKNAEIEARAIHARSRQDVQVKRVERLDEAKTQAYNLVDEARSKAAGEIEVLKKNADNECEAIRTNARAKMEVVANRIIERIMTAYGNS